jgi:hypothetical protein
MRSGTVGGAFSEGLFGVYQVYGQGDSRFFDQVVRCHRAAKSGTDDGYFQGLG